MAYYSGFWGASYALSGYRNAQDSTIARAFEQAKTPAAIAKALNGAAPGATAYAARKQIAAQQATGAFDLGGKRTVVDRVLINRATTTTDKTNMDALYDANYALPATAVDKSGWLAGRSYRVF